MTAQLPILVLRYKAAASRVGLLLMAALSPIWLFWVPYVIFWLGSAVWAGGLLDAPELTLTVVYFAFLFALCCYTVTVCLDNKLILTQSGLRLPVRFILNTFFRRNFSWGELKEIVYAKNGKPDRNPDEMILDFGKSKPALVLYGFTSDEIEQLYLALEAYSPHTHITPEKVEIKGTPRIHGSKDMSFTRMWEDELNNRFGSTIFIPKEPGETLQDGRLKIIGQIAFGGLSAIYLARLNENDIVVIKEAVVPLNADEDSKAKALEMFNREAQFLVTLKHPRIANVFDHFIEQGRNYLVLEYIEGKDLRTYVKEQGAVNEQTVLRWAGEIAELLAYLHDLEPPIVHRDLTPDNLVLAKDGSISLIDFGAANAYMGTATGTLVGKQSYISPEQFRGKAIPASDLYSLGCTLHYLLTGKDPEPLAVSDPRTENDRISDQTAELVMALTQMESQDRPIDARDVLNRLRPNERGSIISLDAVVEQP